MWLRDFIPSDFPECRVLAWGYESGLQSTVATMGIADFARQLLIAVGTARETGSDDSEMVCLHAHHMFVTMTISDIECSQLIVQ
jgi:hypothetical protein